MKFDGTWCDVELALSFAEESLADIRRQRREGYRRAIRAWLNEDLIGWPFKRRRTMRDYRRYDDGWVRKLLRHRAWDYRSTDEADCRRIISACRRFGSGPIYLTTTTINAINYRKTPV